MFKRFTEEEFFNCAITSEGINKDFLKNWKDIDGIGPRYLTPNTWAVLNDHLDIIQFYVENGLDVATISDLAITAAGHRDIEILKYLVENGADITKYNTILAAVHGGHLDVVEYLLNIFIYSEENVRYIVDNYYITSDLKELLNNYKQFPRTKACK